MCVFPKGGRQEKLDFLRYMSPIKGGTTPLPRLRQNVKNTPHVLLKPFLLKPFFFFVPLSEYRF